MWYPVAVWACVMPLLHLPEGAGLATQQLECSPYGGENRGLERCSVLPKPCVLEADLNVGLFEINPKIGF